MREGQWTGTARDLQQELDQQATRCEEAPFWPSEERAFGKWLRSKAPQLGASGVSMTFKRAGNQARNRLVLLKDVPPSSLPQPQEPPHASRKALTALVGVLTEPFIDVWREGLTICVRGPHLSDLKVGPLVPFAEELAPLLPVEAPPRRRPLTNL